MLVPLITVELPQSSRHKSLLTGSVGLDFIILRLLNESQIGTEWEIIIYNLKLSPLIKKLSFLKSTFAGSQDLCQI